MPDEHRFWEAPVEFATHAIVGSLIFGFVALPAVGLNLGTHKLESYCVDPPIIYGLEAAEYILFVVDLVLLGIFLWRAAKRTIQKL